MAEKRSASDSTPSLRRGSETIGRVWADLARTPAFDLRRATDPWEVRHARGKALRSRTPRGSHGEWRPPPNRPDPLALIRESNQGRVRELIPLRMGRMAASRFGFLRGSAVVMAWDLAHTPVSGIRVLIDGDAHLSNFGLFGTEERDVVFDLDDFDEAIVGPWEWDLKRLVTSVEVAGRDLGLDGKLRRYSVRCCLQGYHDEIGRLESKGALDIWYLFLFTRRKQSVLELDPDTRALLRTATAKATRRTNAALLRQVAVRSRTGTWQLRESPPVQTRVSSDTRRKVIEALDRYAMTLPRDRRYLLSRYHVVDVVRHVVGVGSVGTRVYLALLFGNGEGDPLFLQLKEATVPAASAYVPPLPKEFVEQQGKRVITAQRGLNSSPDILLGWTRIDGRPYYVRQAKNMKGSVPLEELGRKSFPRYVRACGAVLARAHARGGDAAMIAGYWGSSEALDEALVRFAQRYGDQVERDHAALVKAVSAGRVSVISGV